MTVSTVRRYPPPPPGNALHLRVTAARVVRFVDSTALFFTPIVFMLALLLTLLLPFVTKTHDAGASCTLVGQTWSCTR
jgi:hypothetical protein